jgi:integrase
MNLQQAADDLEHEHKAVNPRWRGRHGERNAVFADLLVQTGMRLGEAASLLVPEVPPLHGAKVLGDIHLSPAATKREKSRTVYLPLRNLRELHRYLEIERDELVQRMLSGGGYPLADDHLAVVRTGRHSLKLYGERGTRAYNEIDTEERRRLVQVNQAGEAAGPLWLWLGEDGSPLQPSTWQSAFQRANQRCAKFGIPLEVHPHTLRHTYAVHMLGLLLRQTIRALGQREDRRLPERELRRLLIGNPMRKLQLLLGHRRESTVYLYLDVLDDAQEIVHAALAEWDAQVEALALVKADAAETAA